MVSFEENRLVMPASIDQKINRLAGFRPTINIVAEKDVNGAHGSRIAEISVDHSEHLLKQIGAAVNVADRVDPNSFWQSGLSNCTV